MPYFWHINELRMRGILGEKMAAVLKVCEEAFESAISFSLKKRNATTRAWELAARNQKSEIRLK